MNKTALKNFAVWARNKLIADIEYKAGLMGITGKGIATALPQSTQEVQFFDIGTKDYASVRGEEIRQRDSLVQAIRIKEKDVGYAAAFHFIVEKVAYTWFNRLVAIRFMEVNDYLPSRVRVLSSENENKAEPDMVTKPFDTDMEFSQADQNFILRLKDDNRLDALFRWLFIKQCYKLHEALPLLFDSDKMADGRRKEYMELLLTISFTDKDGVLWHLVHDIKERDFRIRTPEDDERQRIENIPDEEMPAGQVEIIGWLYQYYNTEPKDQVFADLKKNIKISKDKIPAATQLFTPDWIVRYMVENSLGRLWIDHLRSIEDTGTLDLSQRNVKAHMTDGNVLSIDSIEDFTLIPKWKYYLYEAEQTPEVQERIKEIRASLIDLRPEDIKVMDPCMGSGHILVYLFEVLMQIYETQGWTQRDAAQSIVQNNLYGLDIDERAAQLAYFAVMMKARQYDRRFLERGIAPHVYDIRETSDMNPDYLSLFGDLLEQAQTLFDEMRDAKTYGSILKLSLSEQEVAQLRQRLEEIKDTYYDNFFDSARQNGLVYDFEPILEVAEALARKYDVVVTNPPYMGSSGMSEKLLNYAKDNYPCGKDDLFSCFIERIIPWVKKNSFCGLMTSYTWMFLTGSVKLRKYVLDSGTIQSLIQPEYHAFFQDANVPICTFTLRIGDIDYKGSYIRLSDFYGADIQESKALEAIRNPMCGWLYHINRDMFKKIPGMPFAYWIPSKTIELFVQKPLLSTFADMKQGLITGDNDRFLRSWYECNMNSVSISGSDRKKWFFYHKGGEFRKWYGNITLVVNWSNNGDEIINFRDEKGKQRSRPQNVQYYFRQGFTWTALTVADFNVRYMPANAIFDAKGSSGFTKNDDWLFYTMALCNSKVAMEFLSFLAPTMDYSAGSIGKIPAILDSIRLERVTSIVKDCINLSRTDWDAFETSWDFTSHPLIRHRPERLSKHEVLMNDGTICEELSKDSTLAQAYESWEVECWRRFQRLKKNEEELNRIFIEIYGLQDELTPEVADKDVTVRRADLARDIKSLISYAVGSMFGRYSLDRPGLVFAGGDFDKVYWKYKGQVPLGENGEEPDDAGYAGYYLAEFNYPRFRDSGNWEEATWLAYSPDADNCLPITDEDYGLRDDIVNRFVEFIRVVYGDDTLEENLSFIAKALGNKGNSSREVIRNYFLNDFFKDHCATYSATGSGKRPIYWLFDSGKQNGFKALVYMHRWNADTVGNLRVEYLHRMQRVYEKEIERMQDTIENSSNGREISQATKRREKLVKQLKEARDYDAKIAHAALTRVEIDLDDGVKVNYEKVQKGPDGKSLGILAKI